VSHYHWHRGIREAEYEFAGQGQASRNGVAILARDAVPIPTRRHLPGDASDTQSCYIKAAVQGILVGCLYLPNGNPQPRPKFPYKQAWFERLTAHAAELHATSLPIILAGDYKLVPTRRRYLSVEDPGLGTQCCSLRAGRRISSCWIKDGPKPCVPGIRAVRSILSGITSGIHGRAMRGLRLDHFLLSPALAERLADAGVDKDVRGAPHASDHAPAWVVLRPGSECAAPRQVGVRRHQAAASKSPI
jgi:exodeoxyribonuclease-3